MDRQQFQIALEQLGILLTPKQEKQLEFFYEQLIDWNQKINLTRILEKQEVYLKHYYDSLTLVKAVNLNEIETLCDIGSGAGFPGIVLKIVFPHLKITLVDSLQKRVHYLNEIIKTLQLENITAIHMRAETLAKQKKESFDLVTARAVAKLETLIDYSVPLLNKDGKFVAMKAHIADEIPPAEKKLKKHNAKITKIVSFELPNEKSVRNLVVIEK